MNIKRAFFALAALTVLLPAVASAGFVSPAEGTAVFIANKFFVDGNDETVVTLNLDCNSGLPQHQDDDVTWQIGWETAFVLADIPLGDLAPDCTVSEDDVPGYVTRYVCSDGPIGRGDGSKSFEEYLAWGDAEPCGWDEVAAGEVYYGLIVNIPEPVEVSVTKEWVVGDGGLPVDETVEITIYCDEEILEGGAKKKDSVWKYEEEIDGDDTVTVDVWPTYEKSNCWAEEDIRNSAVESSDNCGKMEIKVGQGDSCTITNTVFYEGIPTLSQYGLAIMALLMLGVGFVGFRRFV